MKWFEQNLSGFKIIYLHDPFSCHKCLDVMSCEDFDDFVPQVKLNDLKKFSKACVSQNHVSEKRKVEPHRKSKNLCQGPYEHSSVNVKVLKQKSFKSSYAKGFHVLPLNSSKKNHVHINTFKKSPVKKRTPVEKISKINSTKKRSCIPAKKQQESKVPGKGTLKRKRWFVNKLNNKNDNYEDDLFENQKFGHFQNLFEEEETDSAEKYEGLKTPVFPFSISPKENTPSPTYKDCYSPTELLRSRKGAEEYQYRRRRRRKLCFADDKIDSVQVNPQNRDADVQKRLEEVARILDQQKEKTSDSEDDPYFSDLLSCSSTVNP